MTERFETHKLAKDEIKKNLFSYFVSGRGRFPFDMLRYDSCWPLYSRDAANLDVFSLTDSTRRQVRSVKLIGIRAPTVERWSSFGWSVGTEPLDRE